MARFFIGIDDTDFGESIGTGALARELMLHLERSLSAACFGVTRHQLFIHPDIPYTSHNSAACLEIDCATALACLESRAAEFIATLLHSGADPGLCVCEENSEFHALCEFGRRTQVSIVRKEEARALADRRGMACREIGGTGGGVIGAVAACGLRMGKDDGRFISLAGVREMTGVLSAQEILSRTVIEKIIDETGEAIERTSLIDTKGWVRPELKKGAIVLRVKRDNIGTGYAIEKEKHLDKH